VGGLRWGRGALSLPPPPQGCDTRRPHTHRIIVLALAGVPRRGGHALVLRTWGPRATSKVYRFSLLRHWTASR
jgi:hypothetical protein